MTNGDAPAPVQQLLLEANAALLAKRAELKKLDSRAKPKQKVKRYPAADPVTGAMTVIEEPLRPTQRQLQIVEASADIQARQPLPSELAFLARHLVQVTLPHSDPGEVPLWSRTNGNLTLTIARTQLDPKTLKPIGYPYGSIPRLLLYWMTTEAKRTKSRTLTLGQTLSQFMREVGISNTGRGKRGNAYRLHDQIDRLLSSSISFLYSEQLDTLRHQSKVNMPIASASELWWDTRHVDQGNLWHSWVKLGEEFFEAITSSVVPVDTRALRVLKKSPLALDIYAWATHKAHSVRAKGEPEFISFHQLAQQFGSDYGRPDNFKQKFLTELRKVRAVYPKFQSKVLKAGLEISNHSRTSVPVSGTRPQLH